jgi:predicted nucleic acid-binding protein
MIVIDASAWVDIAIGEATEAVSEAMAADGHWVVPEHFRLETSNALRGRWLGKQLSDAQFDELTAQLSDTPVDVWPTAALLPRIRALAANANAYDASYIALAEELRASIVTADAKLGRVPGIRCRVIGPT